MIVKLPTDIYERDILNIIKTREDFLQTITKLNKQTGEMETVPIWPEGEKSILYDLCTQNVPAFVHINWEQVNLDEYVTTIKNTYNKHKSMVTLSLVSHCINNLGMGYKTKVQSGELIFLGTEEQ